MSGEKWTAGDGTMEDQRLDPLEIMHDDKRNGEKFLTEDEEYDLEMAFKNDPNFHRTEDLLDEATEKDLFVEFIGESNARGDFSEDLEDGFKRVDTGEDAEFLQIHGQSFEDQDILGDALRKRVELRKSATETKEDRPLYTVDEFKLMSQAASYKSIVELPPEVRKSRPLFSKDVELSDEKIAEQVAAYKECKEKNSWNQYHPADLRFMEKCVKWDWFNRTHLKNQKPPAYADGSPLSDDDVKELATEYYELRKDDPTVFAEMKEKSGEWKKGYFKWKEGDYRGKKQWSCSKSIPIGEGKTKQTKYISQHEPVVLDGESYYVVNRMNEIQGKDGPISFVNINIKKLPSKKNTPEYSAVPSK